MTRSACCVNVFDQLKAGPRCRGFIYYSQRSERIDGPIQGSHISGILRSDPRAERRSNHIFHSAIVVRVSEGRTLGNLNSGRYTLPFCVS